MRVARPQQPRRMGARVTPQQRQGRGTSLCLRWVQGHVVKVKDHSSRSKVKFRGQKYLKPRNFSQCTPRVRVQGQRSRGQGQSHGVKVKQTNRQTNKQTNAARWRVMLFTSTKPVFNTLILYYLLRLLRVPQVRNCRLVGLSDLALVRTTCAAKWHLHL